MNQTPNTRKLRLRLVFRTLAALSIALVPFAVAADQSVTATVTAVHSLSVNSATLALSPTTAADASDSSTTLTFATNDGQTYKITVTAPTIGWIFTPAAGSAESTVVFPELRFVSATSAKATDSTTAGVLITTVNAGNTAIDVVTAIKSVEGTADVTLSASITEEVVAGIYSTTLTYALVATP